MSFLTSKVKICAALVALAGVPVAASAGEIVLKSADNAMVLTGELIGFGSESYIILYQGEALFVPASLVTCEGQDCPSFSVQGPLELAQNTR